LGGIAVPINFSEINYLAVLVAGLATFMLGGLWYMALFGKLWAKLHGYSEEKMKEMQAKVPPPIFFGGMIVCDLVIALVMAILTSSLRVDTAAGGALLGFLIWLGPAAAIRMTSQLASDKPIGLYFIDISYQLIYLVMMGVVLAVWR
jgi:hypothetical protein